jgi:hypothetical protein
MTLSASTSVSCFEASTAGTATFSPGVLLFARVKLFPTFRLGHDPLSEVR